jgi:CRP-like cAMP-binding protein
MRVLPPTLGVDMPTPISPLELMVRKLETRNMLGAEDRAAILDLPHVFRRFHPSTYLFREGDRPQAHCAFIYSGFAYRQKITAQGARQILSIHMRGDFLDLQNLFLNISDHSVQALTEVEVIGIERGALRELALTRPAVGKAMWVDALVDASIYREWIVNVGRRDARARIAHILCELALRSKAAGLGTEDGFELPMSQEQLGDAVGLTSVHVNRTLKSLLADGVIQRDKRFIGFSSWNDIRAVGEFNALYLHLDQASPPDGAS